MLALLPVLWVGLVPFQGAAPQKPPFAELGRVLLDAAEAQRGRARAQPAGAVKPPGRRRLLERLEPLFDRVELGALELWLPRVQVGAEGEMERARRQGEWKDLAAGLLALQRRWLEELGLLSGDPAAELEAALSTLESAVKRASDRGKPGSSPAIASAVDALRRTLLPPAARPQGLTLVVAPSRAHYVALIGAAGLENERTRDALWNDGARRSVSTGLAPAVLAFALAWGPSRKGAPFDEQQVMEPVQVSQHAIHAASHLLSNAILPTAPLWFGEGLAIRDTVRLAQADETLCSGYKGREETPFDSLQDLPESFLIYVRLERSPYRGGSSANLFADELRAALAGDGFRILDLDRGQAAFIAPGPFLGNEARVPGEVAEGSSGLKEGFAEFFRAYSATFVDWLSLQRTPDGKPLLERTLARLRERGLHWQGDIAKDLAKLLFELCDRTLGVSIDPEDDLEAAYVGWLRSGG